ncbi:DUF6069 family protein [Nocardiopsis sp. NPDC058789]|uniref:DUF6069 family protein n=1 Tax=Nocardiopsis TaxID=2013 RepID=UPI003673424C
MTRNLTETRTPVRPTWKPRLTAVLVVTAVNTLLALAAPLLGADLVVAPRGQEPGALAWPAFTLFTAVFALLGWGVLALAERFLGRRGLFVWTVVAVLVTVAMFLPPLTVGATVATVVVLQLSHLVVAAVIPVYWRTSRT